MFALALLASLAGPADSILVEAAEQTSATSVAAPIKLWLNSSRQFREGERARVQVETADDGYLIVFNYDTDGRLRVLFPIDPRDDNFVRGGRRYEIRGRGERESFLVGRDGDGLVYAAVSADPFRLDQLEAGGNWDYTRMSISDRTRDAEADITDLVQGISSGRGFDYDLLDYRVYGYNSSGYYSTGGWYPRPYGYWDDYYCDPWYRPSLFGCRHYPVGGWYLGWGGWGGYYNGYYDSWWYRRNYWSYPRYGRRLPVVVGRPRGYSIVHRDPNGSVRGRGALGNTFSGSLPRGAGDNGRVIYRPRGNDGGRSRPDGDRVVAPRGDDRGGFDGNTSRPRGRRSPVDASDRPNIDREIGGRGPVEFDRGDRARRPRDSDGESRPAVEPRAPREESRGRRGGDERPVERSAPPRAERPRSERPRESPPPRAEPRQSPPPSARPSNGGGGGGHRPRGGRPPE